MHGAVKAAILVALGYGGYTLYNQYQEYNEPYRIQQLILNEAANPKGLEGEDLAHDDMQLATALSKTKTYDDIRYQLDRIYDARFGRNNARPPPKWSWEK